MFTEENLVSNQTLFINFYSLELAYMLFKSVRDFVTDNPFFCYSLESITNIVYCQTSGKEQSCCIALVGTEVNATKSGAEKSS